MPSRFSPGVPIYQPGAAEVQNALAAALGAIERKQDRELQRRLIDAQERRAATAEERARQLHELQMFLQGYRATAPTRPAPEVPEIMRGARIGLARTADDRDEDPLLRGVRLTPDGVTFDPNRRLLTQGRPPAGQRADMLFEGLSVTPGGTTVTPNPRRVSGAVMSGAGATVPLAAALGEMTRPGPDEPPRLRALPGAFVADLGGFTDRPLFEQPMLISSQLRGGGIPENFVPLPGGGYIDLSATPEARARARAEQQRQEELERQRAAATTLARLLGMSDEEIAAAADLSPDLLLAVAGERRVRERAEQDPLARERFIAGEERKRNQALTRITNMLAAGADRQQVAQAMATDPELAGYWNFDDIVAIERRSQRELQEAEADPAFTERRRALAQLQGAPTNELQQQILDALAAGATKDQILSDMRAQGVPDTVIEQARRYMRPIR